MFVLGYALSHVLLVSFVCSNRRQGGVGGGGGNRGRRGTGGRGGGRRGFGRGRGGRGGGNRKMKTAEELDAELDEYNAKVTFLLWLYYFLEVQ